MKTLPALFAFILTTYSINLLAQVSLQEAPTFGSANLEAVEYKLLKTEAKLTELQNRIELMSKQIEKLDVVQTKLVIRINELLNKSFSNDTSKNIQYNNKSEFDYAFNMLQLRKFDTSKKAFELFVEKYPLDLRLGEAFFWLGEIEYNLSNYKEASQFYLKSYKDFPLSPKHNNALYKLSIVLARLNKKKAQKRCI